MDGNATVLWPSHWYKSLDVMRQSRPNERGGGVGVGGSGCGCDGGRAGDEVSCYPDRGRPWGVLGLAQMDRAEVE